MTNSRLGGDPPSPYEERYGYCRVVRTGPLVSVAGTTSITPDGVILGLTPYEQTREIMGRIAHELERVGASLGDLVRTRIYLTDIAWADEVGRAHGEMLAGALPVTSMVQVARLIDERMFVEIEATAWVAGTEEA